LIITLDFHLYGPIVPLEDSIQATDLWEARYIHLPDGLIQTLFQKLTFQVVFQIDSFLPVLQIIGSPKDSIIPKCWKVHHHPVGAYLNKTIDACMLGQPKTVLL